MAKKKVAIFVGHGKSTDGAWDCGCTYKGKTEAELCAPIVGYAIKYLKKSGVTVITDYPNNKINMIKQVAKANKEKANVEVAVHCDYYKAPKGTIPLYTSAKGKTLASRMNKYVKKYVGCKTRGICKRDDLYELNATDMPACIFEVGAITEYKTFKKKADLYGKGIARGICSYLGVTFKA